MAGYNYPRSAKTGVDKRRVISITKRGVREGKTTKEMQRDLSAAGLGQRRQTVQANARRIKSFVNATTPEKREKAKRWYDNVYNPQWQKWKDDGLTRHQIKERFRRSQTQSYENLTALELDEVLAIREMYQRQKDAGVFAV